MAWTKREVTTGDDKLIIWGRRFNPTPGANTHTTETGGDGVPGIISHINVGITVNMAIRIANADRRLADMKPDTFWTVQTVLVDGRELHESGSSHNEKGTMQRLTRAINAKWSEVPLLSRAEWSYQRS
jgi:hypothetical protein